MSAAQSGFRGLVLAIHPTTRGFGWVVFESPALPVDWGVASAKEGRNARLLARFERLLKRYEPGVFVLEVFDGPETRRGMRIQRLCRSMRHLASCRGMETPVYSRTAIRSCFAGTGATTRHEIAHAIAQRIEAFRYRLPPDPKPWQSADPRQALFDAAALALTYFAVRGQP